MNHLPYLWIALVLLCLAGPEAEADPPLAVSAFDSDQAKALQKAWADHLGTPVQITNLLGMKLLKPGGILITFSCSGVISEDLFQKILFGAAVDARRTVQILERLHQGSDHPVLVTFPESAYLKGFICRVW